MFQARATLLYLALCLCWTGESFTPQNGADLARQSLLSPVRLPGKQKQHQPRSHQQSLRHHQLAAAPLPSSIVLADTSLTQFALQTLISNGVPAVIVCLVIAFAASQFRPKKGSEMEDNMTMMNEMMKNPAADLYRDLYGGDEDPMKNKPMGPQEFLKLLKPPTPPGQNGMEISNKGIPSKQFITIRSLNQKLDSYEYSIQAATQSKASAAAALRAKNFDRAIQKSVQGAGVSHSNLLTALPANAKSDLLQLEKQFLKRGAGSLNKIQALQTQLTRFIIDEKMEAMGIVPNQMDPPVANSNATTVVIDAKNTTENSTTASSSSSSTSSKGKWNKSKKGKSTASAIKTKLETDLAQAQKDLLQAELDFVRDVVAVLGSERASGVRMALLGDIAARGTGGLLSQLKERPLTSMLTSADYSYDTASTTSGDGDSIELPSMKPGTGKSLYVTKFPGDVQASQVNELREEVTAIVRAAQPGDEVLVVLQSGGGTVTGYGLAAAQLLRFKENGLKLTIAVEQVAASGGYMMCCVADKIIGSPFAIFGSIGVITEIPNVYERLKNEGIEFQTVTAGEFKRTLTPTKKVTKADLDKSKEDIEDIYKLFRKFVAQNRPSLDIKAVATGETWFGTDALERNLCDEIKAVDDVLTQYVDDGWEVYEVEYTPPMDMALAGAPFKLPGTEGDQGVLSRGLRWLVRTVASEVRSELSGVDLNDNSIEKRYMAKDDTADRTRIEG